MKSTSRIALLGAALMCPVALAWAAPRVRSRSHHTRTSKSRAASRAKLRLAMAPASKPVKAAPVIDQSKLPRYVSLATIKRIHKEYQGEPYPGLQPFWEGHALKVQNPMSDLLTSPHFDPPPVTKKNKPPVYLAQGFPRPVPPAAVPGGARGRARTVVPTWVRYPLEFQLCGVGIGTKAVDKDRFNRIDRYGLFALHGNPTAVVLPVVTASAGGGGGDAGGGAPGGAPGGSDSGRGRGSSSGRGSEGGAPGGEATGAGTTSSTNLTLQQTPPEAAALFPSSQQGGLPDWALAITVQLNQNQVEWLYKRDTYAMGFVVDRLGYCEAIIVAGIQSPIARTQLEDPIHTVKLGDDLRKVLFRYGYPDATVPLGPDPVATANSATGTPGGGGGGAAAGGGDGSIGGNIASDSARLRGGGGAPSAGALGSRGGAAEGGDAGGGGAGGDASNGAFRTYDVRYDQTYNTVFTIRNNRVVRMYIFGDPDFFNAQRRNSLRTRY